jgi:hypothetical protein
MIRALATLLLVAGGAQAADHDFDRVVSAVQKQYGVKPQHVPLMGLANLVVKVAHPAGTGGFKIAVFEDLPEISDSGQRAIDRMMSDVCHGGLRPLVVTHSRRDGETSYILAGEVGKSSKLLIATFERHEATVIEVQVDTDTLFRLLASPENAHRTLQHDRDMSEDDGR